MIRRGGLALALALIAVQAQPAWGYTPAELRYLAQNFGLKPQQARQLLEMVDSQADQLQRLAGQQRIDARALRAAALRLGARNPNMTLPDFLRYAEGLAAQAAEARKKGEELRAVVEKLDPGETRRAALAALDAAELAFNEGRFADADQAYGKLEDLRRSEVQSVRAAWSEAVLARMAIAALGGDNEAASALADRAATQALDWGRHDAWRFRMADAGQWAERGKRMGDRAALERAITIWRDRVAPLAPRETAEEDWARTEILTASTLVVLASRSRGTELFDAAIAKFRSGQEYYDRRRDPARWAIIQADVATAYGLMAERDGGISRYVQSAEILKELITSIDRQQQPGIWGNAQQSMGLVLTQIGLRTSRIEPLEEGLKAYDLALTVIRPETRRLDWVGVQNNIGFAHRSLAELRPGTADIDRAVAAHTAGIAAIKRETDPMIWAQLQSNLGLDLRMKAERTNDLELFDRALQAHDAALLERTRERSPVEWASTELSRGMVLTRIGQWRKDPAALRAGEAAIRRSAEELTVEAAAYDWGASQFALAMVLASRAEIEGQADLAQEALRILTGATDFFEKAGVPHVAASGRHGIKVVKELIAKMQTTSGR